MEYKFMDLSVIATCMLIAGAEISKVGGPCVDYVSFIDHMQFQLQRCNPWDWEDTATRLDRQRRNHHEVAINAVKSLNEIGRKYCARPIYTGDINNRWDVAEFCSEFTSYIFSTRSR